MTQQQKAFKHSKWAWAGKSALALAFSLSLLSPVSAQAGNEHQSVVYDVYAGGIHALQASLDIDLKNDKRYDLILKAHTRGWLSKLAPWHGSFESHGWKVKINDYRPETHKSIATWREETEVKEYRYNKDRSFDGLLITDHERPTHEKEVENTLTDGTTDILTATLDAMTNVGQGKDCQGASDVFDGKRRFKLKFNHKGTETLSATEYNIYEGPTTICTVEVVPVAGAWHKKPRGWMSIQEQGRERGTMPTVWMGKLSEKGPAIPVKILIKTDFGGLYMHLTDHQKNDPVKIAEKQTKK